MPSPDSAVLFDIDGTLVDSTYHHAIAWQRAFDRHDLHLPLWGIHRTVGMGGDKLVGEVAGDEVEQRLGDRLREAWKEEYAELVAEVLPLPGAADLVRSLAQAGYAVALASSGEPEFAESAIDALGVRDQVSVLRTSADVDGSKPEPDLVEVTLEALDVRRAVFVGDTPYDVTAADRGGLRCLTLRTGGYAEAELTEAGAALVVHTPADLADLDWSAHLSPVDRGASA